MNNNFIKDLAEGTLRSVKSYSIYFVNGYRFHTSSHGANQSTINSGVCIKDSTYGNNFNGYYGILIEVVQPEYLALPIKRVVLFRCEWLDLTLNIGVKIHKHYNLVDINHKWRLNTCEPFILASDAEQVIYILYPSLKRDKFDWLWYEKWSLCL